MLNDERRSEDIPHEVGVAWIDDKVSKLNYDGMVTCDQCCNKYSDQSLKTFQLFQDFEY
jgi:hydroxypyruvate isomerase